VNSTKLLAITGDPVLHSKSPFIFNSIFKELAQDAVYTRIAVSRPLEALSLFRKLGLTGMNVTAPFKKSIMPFLDSVEEAASVIGGVNTIVREDDRLRGYNTDYTAVIQSLKERNISIEGKKCIVLGAGGAGRAAVYALVKKKGDVTIVNRTYEKAVAVAGELQCRAGKIEMLQALLKESDIFISTLSSSVDIVPQKWLPAGLLVFDANYKKSPLSQKAEANGCPLIKGEAWLLNQAIPAYRLFFSTEPAREIPSGLIDSVKQSLVMPETVKDLKNISLVGFMGSGKTMIGKKLAEKMGFSFIDTDKRIEEKAGRRIPEIFAAEGESGFRSREKAVLKELMQYHGSALFSCGGGVVLDRENRETLKENSVVIWLYSSIKTTLKRIRRGTRPLLDGEDPAKKARHILNDRLSSYAQTSDIIFSSEDNADAAAEKIHEEIRKTFKN
jgi:shikimate dehydrogenase